MVGAKRSQKGDTMEWQLYGWTWLPWWIRHEDEHGIINTWFGWGPVQCRRIAIRNEA